MTGLEEVNGKGLFNISSKAKAEEQQMKPGGFKFKMKRRSSLIHLSQDVLNTLWFIVAILHLYRFNY